MITNAPPPPPPVARFSPGPSPAALGAGCSRRSRRSPRSAPPRSRARSKPTCASFHLVSVGKDWDIRRRLPTARRAAGSTAWSCARATITPTNSNSPPLAGATAEAEEALRRQPGVKTRGHRPARSRFDCRMPPGSTAGHRRSQGAPANSATMWAQARAAGVSPTSFRRRCRRKRRSPRSPARSTRLVKPPPTWDRNRLEATAPVGEFRISRVIMDQVKSPAVRIKLNSDAARHPGGRASPRISSKCGRFLGHTAHIHNLKDSKFPYQLQVDLLVRCGWDVGPCWRSPTRCPTRVAALASSANFGSEWWRGGGCWTERR